MFVSLCLIVMYTVCFRDGEIRLWHMSRDKIPTVVCAMKVSKETNIG